MYLIKSGNYFKDTVDNIVEILKREQTEDVDSELQYFKRVHDIYDNDVFIIPSPPAIAVAWTGFTEQVRTIGQRNPVHFTIVNKIIIYYYHEELNVNIKREDIRDALWEVARIMRRNSDLNGLSSVGATIISGQLINRVRSNNVYAGGTIEIDVPVLVEDRRGLSTL
jgi:hypothetical protein